MFLNGARPSKHEATPLLAAEFDPAIKLVEEIGGLYLEMRFDHTWSTQPSRKLVTTELLGRAAISNERFEQPDGTPLAIATDYFGKSRDPSNPTPGPFECPDQGPIRLRVR